MAKPVSFDQAVADTSRHASPYVLHWTRKLLLKRTIRWLGVVTFSALLLITDIERRHTPPKNRADWLAMLVEFGMLFYASYKAQIYNETALITGLAMDQKLQDEPYSETLIRRPNV